MRIREHLRRRQEEWVRNSVNAMRQVSHQTVYHEGFEMELVREAWFYEFYGFPLNEHTS